MKKLAIVVVCLASWCFATGQKSNKESRKPVQRKQVETMVFAPVQEEVSCKARGFDATGYSSESASETCRSRCGTLQMEMSPPRGILRVGKTINVTVRSSQFGVGDRMHSGKADIDWGDGTQDRFLTGPIVTISHRYYKPGKFMVRAYSQIGFRYEGEDACTYACCADAAMEVVIGK